MQQTNRNYRFDQHLEWILIVVAMLIPVITLFSMTP